MAVLPRDPRIPLEINIKQADYVFYPGQPAMITLRGDLNDLDVSVQMSGDGVFARGTEKPVVVTVPFKWVFSDKLEADGKEVCAAAMRWVYIDEN